MKHKINKDLIQTYTKTLTEWRHDLHANPELAFNEVRTSGLIKERLESFGIKAVTGFAKTGIVGVLQNGSSKKAIGLRADIDALPIFEETGLAYKSGIDGKMHACGHDGHTTMLLGAAKYLAETKNFDGTVYFYFQPAEEKGGGANVMLEEGLFEKFKPDEVYAVHNMPNTPIGEVGNRVGPIMAAADEIKITIKGQGGHGAFPHLCKDPVVIAAQFINIIQSFVSRNTDPLDSSVISITNVVAPSAFNVIPDNIVLGGTIRTLKATTQAMLEKKIRDTLASLEKIHEVSIDFEYIVGYPVTINTPEQTEFAIQVAADLFGADKMIEVSPSMGAEDFSFMLEQVAGNYCWLGNGDSAGLHNAKYNFDDRLIPQGVAYFAGLAEAYLS